MVANDGKDEAAEARKKRKAILNQRHEEPDADNKHNDSTGSGNEGRAGSASVASASVSSETASHQDEPMSKKQKAKAQVRYDPEVPMSKTELANWRKEHRRVRNRESAAASRQRIRSRITELEGEVEQWKDKYQEAVDRLTTLQSIDSHPPQPVSNASAKRGRR